MNTLTNINQDTINWITGKNFNKMKQDSKNNKIEYDLLTLRDYKYLCKNNHLNWYIFDAFANRYRECTEKISGKVHDRNGNILYSHFIFHKTRLIRKKN